MMEAYELISRFYTAFGQRDWQAMNACYSDDILFSDPAFGFLRGEEVKGMWEMLCKNAQDLQIEFGNIKAVDEEYFNCDWTASYTFSATGNKVVNHIKAYMRIREGKITEHSDAFKLSKWAGQALGWKGKLLGWSGFFKKRVQKKARARLVKFIENRNIKSVTP
jgi:ketosteroid isomerase-like protein